MTRSPIPSAPPSFGRRAFLKATGGALVLAWLSPLRLASERAAGRVAATALPDDRCSAPSAALAVSLTKTRDFALRIGAQGFDCELPLAEVSALIERLAGAGACSLPPELGPELATARMLLERYATRWRAHLAAVLADAEALAARLRSQGAERPDRWAPFLELRALDRTLRVAEPPARASLKRARSAVFCALATSV